MIIIPVIEMLPRFYINYEEFKEAGREDAKFSTLVLY